MESKTNKQVRSGKEYEHLFPKPDLNDITQKRNATVTDTVRFIPKVVKVTLEQTKNIAPLLKGQNVYESCKNIWHFLYEHVKYKKDKDGYEQIRSPARLWHDRFEGVDCDCFTTTILSLLHHCGIRNALMRITKYRQNHFQHIYPIVPVGNGKYITMDCVVDRFNYEEPYTEKKDYTMDLQYLNGIEETSDFSGNVDAQDLFSRSNDLGELGKLFKKHSSSSAIPGSNQDAKGKKGFRKIKAIAKKALNITNKVNPATAVLRAGILASMKLNVMKVAENLKWAYLTEAEAKKKGLDMSKFSKLKNVLTKIEGIFYTAGGNPENLKKAILTGRGNRHKEVSGLGLVDTSEIEFSGFGENTPMPELLGDVYQDEFVNGLEGTEGLGIIATSASVAAASTVMGSIALLLKSIGSLFPKKKGSTDAKDEGGSDSSDSSATDSTGDGTESSETGSDGNLPANGNKQLKKVKEDSSSAEGADEDNSKDSTDDSKKGLKGFWENNKKWIKPVGIGIAVAGVLYAGYKIVRSNSDNGKKASKGQAALNGFHKKRKKRKEGKRKRHGKKSGIALL